MIVLDSSGWIEVLTEGQNYNIFAPCVGVAKELLVPTIILYEVTKYLQIWGDDKILFNALSAMRQATIVPLTETIAINAATQSRIYKLAMADSIILATSHILNATLWTQDKHFKDIEGVKYFSKEV